MRSIKWALPALILVLGSASVALAANGVKGTLKSAAANEMVVTDEQGKDWTFRVADRAIIVCPDKENAKASDLKAGAPVSVIFDKKGDAMTATAILHHDGALKDALLSTGSVKTAADASGNIVISDSNGKDWTFSTNDQSKVRLNNAPAKINELKRGQEVVYVYEKKGDQLRLLDVCDCPRP